MPTTHITKIFSRVTVTLLTTLCLSKVYAFSDWQGSYLGLYTGGNFASQDYSTNAGGVTASSYFTTGSDVSAINQAASPNRHASNIIYGFSGGHDYLWQQWIYGIVLDYGAMPINTSQTISGATLPSASDTYTVYTSMSTNWLMTLRGRVGYPMSLFSRPSLIYATGGLAITQVSIHNNYSDNSSLSGTGSSQNAENMIGWAGGVGMEMFIFNHTTLNLEYLYVQFPSANSTATISNSAAGFGVPAHSLSNPLSTNGDMATNLIRLGVNYRFDV